MKLHKSQVLLLLLLCFLAGVGAGPWVNPHITRILLYIAAALAVVTATTFWTEKRYWLVGFCILTGVFGAWHYQNSPSSRIDGNHIAFYNNMGKIEWEGVVTEEPDVRPEKVNLTIGAQKMLFPKSQEISGKVLVTVGKYPEYSYGDKLKISGRLETPFESEQFSYKNYLAKGRVYSVSYYPQLARLARGQGNVIKAALLNLKENFSQRLAQVMSEPQNSLLLGLLVGARRAMPQELLEAFKITGVTHIIAISGFNISIITRLLGNFIHRRAGRRASLVVSTLVVLGFVIITGAQASVVRAAIMGLLTVVALNLGRANFATNALMLAAAAMVLFNPAILAFDVGFQLSFLATAGLIYLSDFLERFLRRVPEFLELRASLSATLAAQIFVVPLLIYHFDQLSLIAPLANLLILPLIPITMLFGFISGVAALLWIPLSYLTAWITWAFLSYQIFAAEQLAKIPFAAVAVDSIPAAGIANYYLLLLLTIFILHVRKREEAIFRFRYPRH